VAGYADVIFGGGAIYTADPGGRRLVPATAADGRPATAVAIAGGSVIAVGAADDDLAGPRTEFADLRGRALVPGFQDAHVHPAFAGVTMIGCNLIGAATLDEAIAPYLASLGLGVAPRPSHTLTPKLAVQCSVRS